MARLLVVCAALGLALVTMAPAAQAKGEGIAIITGHGQTPTVVVTHPADVAALFWGGGLGEPERVDPPDQRTKLGSRYELKFVLWDQGEKPAPIVSSCFHLPTAAGMGCGRSRRPANDGAVPGGCQRAGGSFRWTPRKSSKPTASRAANPNRGRRQATF